jgi:hypothetical protein
MLTQENLRAALATIFDVDEDFIVPKQGTWWNAQDRDPTKGTWIAYLKTDGDPRVLPSWQPVPRTDPIQPGPISQGWVRSKVDLQIVGTVAELLANSIVHWINRDDVMAIWNAIEVQMFAAGFGRYQVTPFIQAGVNTVLAYNVSFELLWSSSIQATQQVINSADITGDLIVEV